MYNLKTKPHLQFYTYIQWLQIVMKLDTKQKLNMLIPQLVLPKKSHRMKNESLDLNR